MQPESGANDQQNQPSGGQPWDSAATPPSTPAEPVDPATGAAAPPSSYGSAPGGYGQPAAPSGPPAGYGSAPGGYGQPSSPAQQPAQQPTTQFPPVSDQTQVLPSTGQGYGSAPSQPQPSYGQQPTTALPTPTAYGQQQYGQPQTPQYPQQTAPGQPQYGQAQGQQYGQPGGYQQQPMYGQPGAGQQPQKSKTGVIVAVLVAVVVVLAVGGFLLANGPLKKTVLDNGAVASTIERQAENNDIDVSGVSCPADQEVKADATFTCSSDAGDITVKITSDDGDWEWSLN